MNNKQKLELIWEGKYAEGGKGVAPLRVALPFQTVETVNEAAQDRQKTLMLEPTGAYDTQGWRNRLIWGDKKYVLPSLLSDFGGKVNLIYIDPPFDTGQDFSFTAVLPEIPETEEAEVLEFTKQPSMIEQKAYRDTWGKGVDSYLQWMYETLTLLRELLAETGSIFVHLDVHRGPYVKLLMDEIFGAENFQNEIAWYYYNKLHRDVDEVEQLAGAVRGRRRQGPGGDVLEQHVDDRAVGELERCGLGPAHDREDGAGADTVFGADLVEPAR
jgi:hypothetical protein